jgi:endonuclease/exonuclease/phosphatase family metal-dependent hydrolase
MAACARPACATTPSPTRAPARATPAASPAAAAIRIDGTFADWPAGTYLAADERYLYVRLALPEERTVQASAQPLVVAIDLQAAGAFTPDLRVVFSPRATDGQGVAVETPGHRGTAVGHAALDLVAAPTVASRTFELRVARDVRGRPELSALFAAGPARVQASLLRADGAPAWRSRAYQIELPTRAAAAPDAAGAPEPPPSIPVLEADALRVVSWNVLVASPRKRPAPFARVLRALGPDVVLLQEWAGATDEELAAWFDTHLPGSPPWHAVTSEGWGVAVVARGALAELVPRKVSRPQVAPADFRRDDPALRIAAGVAATRIGPLCAASLHLKCCGAADSPQDLARRAEAAAANEALRAALGARGPCVRVIGGDLNLVGSSRPLELLAAALDEGGGGLVAAVSPVLGDAALYTWVQPWSRFSPGRLDYLLHGPAAARLLRSFALDTRRLDAAVLAAHGLERFDSAASDHLPVVLDLLPLQSGSSSGLANSKLNSDRCAPVENMQTWSPGSRRVAPCGGTTWSPRRTSVSTQPDGSGRSRTRTPDTAVFG